MNRPNNTNPPLSLEQAEETRIRRALGLTGSGTHQQRPEQARQRHRFVSDGAVPVVVLNRTDSETSGIKDKLAAAEAALETERTAHAQTRRSLQEAQAAHQALQTQLAHAQLAHKEALATEQAARRAADEALVALKSTVPPVAAPRPAEARPVEAKLAEPRLAETRLAEPKRRGRKPGPPKPPKEQKPVRWWTPSFKAKSKA